MKQTHFMLYKIYWRLKYCKIHCFWFPLGEKIKISQIYFNITLFSYKNI
jgi:hypothetical protein